VVQEDATILFQFGAKLIFAESDEAEGYGLI
jgi:hypothetical protein